MNATTAGKELHNYANNKSITTSLSFCCWFFLRQLVISLLLTVAHRDTASLCDTNRIEKTPETGSLWKGPPPDGSCIQLNSLSGSGLYWQSRMERGHVKVWDGTVWHISHTTWMTHPAKQHHIPHQLCKWSLSAGSQKIIEYQIHKKSEEHFYMEGVSFFGCQHFITMKLLLKWSCWDFFLVNSSA